MAVRLKPQLGTQPNTLHPHYHGLFADVIFNEGQGARVWDHCARRAGILTNFTKSAEWVIRDHGRSVEFDGVNDHISIPYNDLQKAAGGFTILTHMYVSAANSNKAVCSKASPTTASDGWWITVQDPSGGRSNAIQATYGDTDYFSSNNAMPTNTWVWLSIVWDGAELHFGIDGVGISSVTSAGTLTDGSDPLLLGRESNAYTSSIYLDGGMDYFRMWNFANNLDTIHSIIKDPYAAYFRSGFTYQHVAAAGGGNGLLLLNQASAC